MSESHKGKKQSKETSKKKSESMKKWWSEKKEEKPLTIKEGIQEKKRTRLESPRQTGNSQPRQYPWKE